MAGDGGRVPDVSEQRAEDCHEAGIRDLATQAMLDALAWMDPSTGRKFTQEPSYVRLKAALSENRNAPEPASVLAALLAESPEATVAALEALLTSDEAVDHTLDEMTRVFVDYGPNFARLNPNDMRMVALRLSRGPCRSLLSKAPKEDRDA
jgi:hypothetical protein